MEFTARDEAILEALSAGPMGVNELFRRLAERGLASDKRQVSRSLEKLEEAGLIARERRGQRVLARLTDAGEVYTLMRELAYILEDMKKILTYEKIDGDTLRLFLSQAGINISREEALRLARKIREAARKARDCSKIADIYIIGMASAGFLYAHLRRLGSPLAELVGRHMASLVEYLEEIGCLEGIRKRLDNQVKSVKDAMEKTIRAALTTS